MTGFFLGGNVLFKIFNEKPATVFFDDRFFTPLLFCFVPFGGQFRDQYRALRSGQCSFQVYQRVANLI